MPLHDTIARVTDRIVARSKDTRGPYMDRMARAAEAGPARAPDMRQSGPRLCRDGRR